MAAASDTAASECALPSGRDPEPFLCNWISGQATHDHGNQGSTRGTGLKAECTRTNATSSATMGNGFLTQPGDIDHHTEP